MKVDFKVQSEDLTLANLIDNEMEKKPKKIYMFIGTLKESGFDILEESIIDTKAKLTLFIGIDKKNTTKGLLDNILEYTKDVYVYNNNDLKEFESNIYIFEYDKKVSMYLSPSKSSEGGLLHDLSIFCRVLYDLNDENDKKEYKYNLKTILDLKKLDFVKLDKDLIQQFVDDKVIFSNKQYEHSVKSISEFLGKNNGKKIKEAKKQEQIVEENLNIPIIDLSESKIDIDISDAVEDEISKTEIKVEPTQSKVKKTAKKVVQNEEKFENEVEDYEEISEEDKELFEGTLDLSDMILTKSSVKLSNSRKEKEEEKGSEEEKVIFKKLDLNNISNYMFELPGKQQNGQDHDVIKIPNHIMQLIPNFFEFIGIAKAKVINGSQYKVKDIQLEIVDVKNGIKFSDKEAKMMQKKGQTYMTIMSKYLAGIDYEENDIARIIKLSSKIYHIEIVSKNLQEYKIWNKIMNKKIRGSDRKYGIM